MPIHEIVLDMPEEVVSEITEESTEESHDHELETVEAPKVIEINGLLGAPPGAEADLVIEIEEELDAEDQIPQETGPVDKWKIPKNLKTDFFPWVKQRISECPNHSGYDADGCERAIHYMKHISSLISKAMASDLDGDLNAEDVNTAQTEIKKGIEGLESRIKNITKAKGGKKKASEEVDEEGLVKEAQQSPGVKGVYITVPLFISTIARLCINGTVSAGHDMEDLFKKCSEKFELTEREKYEVRQLIFDMGFPIRFDRLSWVGEDVDTTSTENGDWSANYGDRG